MSFTKLDYCQYLLSSQVNYTLTNLAEHLKSFSHDTINRYLKGEEWGAPLSAYHCQSQLLRELDVELHPDQGGGFEEKPHQGVQTGVLPAGSNRPQTSRSALSRAQSSPERALEMAQGVRGKRRGSLHREATLLPRGDARGEDRGAGAFLRQARPGERGPKKGLS